VCREVRKPSQSPTRLTLSARKQSIRYPVLGIIVFYVELSGDWRTDVSDMWGRRARHQVERNTLLQLSVKLVVSRSASFIDQGWLPVDITCPTKVSEHSSSSSVHARPADCVQITVATVHIRRQSTSSQRATNWTSPRDDYNRDSHTWPDSTTDQLNLSSSTTQRSEIINSVKVEFIAAEEAHDVTAIWPRRQLDRSRDHCAASAVKTHTITTTR